jgi:hypothetical protein
MGDLRMKRSDIEALHEVARHNFKGVLYWFRPRTMERLQRLGLVEQWTPPSVAERPRLKARPWRLTDAGRAQRGRLNTLSLISPPPHQRAE